MEWLCKKQPMLPVTSVLFDFDGTISTLRCGWEAVMESLMCELLGGSNEPKKDIRDTIRQYIDESTGVQTIFQMKWLAEQLSLQDPAADYNPWDLKAEYNSRLMNAVMGKRGRILSGEDLPEDYMIKGSREVLEMLAEQGVTLYIASGTDDADVKQEADVLGLAALFSEIKGAPEGREDCSKEAVVRSLIGQNGEAGTLAVVGDGKVEIAIGRENGARTLGLASDEQRGFGVNPVKRERLVKAGADAITGDFQDMAALKQFFFGDS